MTPPLRAVVTRPAARIGTGTLPPLESILAAHTYCRGVHSSYALVCIPVGVESSSPGTPPF